MTPLSAKKILLSLVVFLASAALIAEDIPLRNWEVPPYTRSSGSSTGIRTMTDVTSPRVFIGVAPCRIVDTRAGSGFPAGYGPPSMAAGVPRNFDLNNGPCPGLPATIDAYSLNVTVTNTAGEGFIKFWPQGGAVPDVSSLNYVAGQTVANAVIVPAGTGGGVTAVAGVSGTDLIIDINGYFSYTLGTPGNSFLLINDAAGVGTVTGFNNSPSGYGVWGGNPNGIGVLGTSEDHNGVWAQSTNFDALAAFGGRDGGYLQGARHGVIGVSTASSGVTYGVLGASASGSQNAAGVIGVHGTATAGALTFNRAGVRGDSGGFGVLGISTIRGVQGFVVSGTPSVYGPSGVLGAVDGSDPGSGAAPWAVFAFGDTGATGTKHFLDPHPTDPSRVIAYISLEGPEAGTYFRGRGKFENGLARIPVPEHFRAVTDSEGLTVQVTPIGAMASFGVMKMDLDEIVVQSSRNVEFSYLVQGVRRSFKDKGPVRVSSMFAPESAEAKMPDWLSAEQRRVLIQNGTYREDGTVNMETARRLGWDRMWEQIARPQPQPEQPPTP